MEWEGVSIWCLLQAFVKPRMVRGYRDTKHAKTEVFLVMETKPAERRRRVHVVDTSLVVIDTKRRARGNPNKLIRLGHQEKTGLIYNSPMDGLVREKERNGASSVCGPAVLLGGGRTN